MTTDVNRLKVSLTKHGSHKIAFLVERYDKDDILNNLVDFPVLDEARVRNILSITVSNIVPSVWNQVRQYGREDIFDVVFVAIVFSHFQTIDAMIQASDNGFVIERDSVLGGKAYTNFAHTIEQFDYFIEHTSEFISYNISRIFKKYYITGFIRDILEMKLRAANWDGQNSLSDECCKLNFHKVFGLSKADFSAWIGSSDVIVNEIDVPDKTRTRSSSEGFRFKAGHNSKYEGHVDVKPSKKQKAVLLHNEIQNKLFELLADQYSADNVGTECPTSTGIIDIVRRHGGKYFFYEIKTSKSDRRNIRDALAQLLEYAYWNDIAIIQELLIVSPCKLTSPGKKYLDLLRDKFGIPISYQFFNLSDGTLSDPL